MRTCRSRVAVVGLLAMFSVAGLAPASQASPPVDPCSQPPSVTVDQSDPNFTRITISLSCSSATRFHRVISATVGGVEILSIDTLTDVVASASAVNRVKIPKAAICVTDPDEGGGTCLPAG